MCPLYRNFQRLGCATCGIPCPSPSWKRGWKRSFRVSLLETSKITSLSGPLTWLWLYRFWHYPVNIPPSSDGWVRLTSIYGAWRFRFGSHVSDGVLAKTSGSLDTRIMPFSFRIDTINDSSQFNVPRFICGLGRETLLPGRRWRGTTLSS